MTPMTPRDASRSSLSDHCSMNGGISLSRNASSSSLKATSSGDQAKSTSEHCQRLQPSAASCGADVAPGPAYRAQCMDFTFSADRTRCATRCARSCGAKRRRNTCGAWPSTTTPGITPEVWRKIVDLGWTGLLVPEALGGLGLGIVDAVVVQEEMGRAVFPGPYFSSAIVATLAARALGLDDQLAALAAGTRTRHGRARRSGLRRSDRAHPRARARARARATSSTA